MRRTRLSAHFPLASLGGKSRNPRGAQAFTPDYPLDHLSEGRFRPRVAYQRVIGL
jgi:hypothetical protein